MGDNTEMPGYSRFEMHGTETEISAAKNVIKKIVIDQERFTKKKVTYRKNKRAVIQIGQGKLCYDPHSVMFLRNPEIFWDNKYGHDKRRWTPEVFQTFQKEQT